MKVLYTGSFDPITEGHLDIIKRCSEKFDEVVVTVFNNSDKKHFFTVEERFDLVSQAVSRFSNVKVDITCDMVVNYARDNNIDIIIRGLRAVSDYEYELKIAAINRHLYPKLETLFMMSSPNYSFISSSIVKEVVKYNGDISDLVPENVINAIKDKLRRDSK